MGQWHSHRQYASLEAAKEKLEIVNALGFAFHFARPPIPSPDCEAIVDEDRIPFELFQEYTANFQNSSACGRQGFRVPLNGIAFVNYNYKLIYVG